MKKRILPLLLALVMVLALCPAPAFAASSDFVIVNGELIKYNGPGGDVVIPDGVTKIGRYYDNTLWLTGYGVFEYRTDVTSVTIPDSVTEIDGGAFKGCTGLTNVTIGNGVAEIPWPLFLDCTGLKRVTIGSGVTEIDDWVFWYCTSLTDITVSSANQHFASVGGVLFSKDRAALLRYPRGKQGSYVIPDGVTSIGDYAFYGRTGLTSVTIPDGVTSIGDYAFYGCTGLTSVTIPDGVTTIGGAAFHGCTGLTSVTIPASVTKIDGGAFGDCTSLTDVQYGGSEEQWRAIQADYNFSTITTIHYNGVTPIGWGFIIEDGVLLEYKGFGNVTIPDGVTAIGDYAFYNRIWDLESVTIPEGVTSIGDYAFYHCENLTSVNIPSSVTSIGANAFYRCDSLTEVTIPDGVTSIGDYAFSGCGGLTSLTIPGSVTEMGKGAFSWCGGVRDVTILHGVTEISEQAFYEVGVTSVTIPASVTSIGADAFSYTYSWSYDYLTDVYYAGSEAQWNRIAILSGNDLHKATIHYVTPTEDFIIEDGVLTNYVGNHSDVKIPNSVTAIGPGAFRSCAGLTSATIPNGVTTIGDWAFATCTGLTSVTIPASVTEIGDNAFFACPLTDVYYGGSEAQWNAISIAYNRELASATIHYNSATPAAPTLPTVENIPASGTAVETRQTIMLDGVAKEFQCYAIMNADGNGANYIKIRDLADALNGTGAQFNVGWNGKIMIQSNAAYQPNGSENTIAYAGDQAYESISNIAISFNGQDINLTAINIQGGNTYYKLRDLGQLLNFNVKWDAAAGQVAIESNKPYDPND